MPLIRSRAELKKAFENQVAALNSSCAGYDRGEEWEAARMATAVYALLHDGGKRNISILTQMDVLKGLKFIASGHEVRPGNLAPSTPLVVVRLTTGQGAKYLPRLGNGPNPTRYMPFKEWWERDPIYQTGARAKPFQSLSRKRLVFGLRNKEGGGSHYDPVLQDEAYIAASKDPVWFSVTQSGKTPLLQLELASMRQVAWEVLETFRESGIAGTADASLPRL